MCHCVFPCAPCSAEWQGHQEGHPPATTSCAQPATGALLSSDCDGGFSPPQKYHQYFDSLTPAGGAQRAGVTQVLFWAPSSLTSRFLCIANTTLEFHFCNVAWRDICQHTKVQAPQINFKGAALTINRWESRDLAPKGGFSSQTSGSRRVQTGSAQTVSIGRGPVQGPAGRVCLSNAAMPLVCPLEGTRGCIPSALSQAPPNQEGLLLLRLLMWSAE